MNSCSSSLHRTAPDSHHNASCSTGKANCRKYIRILKLKCILVVLTEIAFMLQTICFSLYSIKKGFYLIIIFIITNFINIFIKECSHDCLPLARQQTTTSLLNSKICSVITALKGLFCEALFPLKLFYSVGYFQGAVLVTC